MKSLIAAGCVFLMSLPAAAALRSRADCEPLLSRRPRAVRLNIRSAQEALAALSHHLPEVFPVEHLREKPWYQLLEHFALPSIRSHTPLLVSTFVGGGNAGKSSLMNAMAGLLTGQPELRLREPISQTGFYPGLTQRMVIAMAPGASETIQRDLRERFGQLEAWTSPSDVTAPGPGLLVNVPEIPRNLAFVDSPDFDTGQIGASEPDNLNRALRVVGPSDVLILLFNPQTVRNHATMRTLAKIFRGYGLKRSILVFWADATMPGSEANQLLTSAAHAIYDSANGDLSGVLGTYFMPYSSAVPGGEAHPELLPLGNSPPFVDLVRSMNADSSELKKYAIDNASRIIQDDVAREVRERIKSLMAAEIYRQGVNALTDAVSRDSLEDFPYLTLRDEIRRRFARLASGLGQAVQGLSSWLAVPENKIATLLHKFGQRSDRFTEQLELGHLLHDKIAVTQLVLQLQKGALTFNNGRADAPAVQNLIALSRKFFETFPEERIASGGETATEASSSGGRGRMRTARLPRAALLPPPAQEALRHLFDADTAKLTKELGARLDAAQFDNSLSEASQRQIYRALARIQQSRGLGNRGTVAALDLMTLGAPAAASYMLAHHDINATLIYLAAINLTARPFHKLSEVMNDRFLQRRLNEWFHALQYRTTTAFFEESVTSELMQALRPPEEGQEPSPASPRAISDQEALALQQIQGALKFLNPEYKVINFTE